MGSRAMASKTLQLVSAVGSRLTGRTSTLEGLKVVTLGEGGVEDALYMLHRQEKFSSR